MPPFVFHVARPFATLILLSGPALAAGSDAHAPSEVVFIGQIVTLLLCGRLLGEGMQRLGQPAVMGQLIAGLLLGPSVFGVLWPEGQKALFPPGGNQKVMIDAVAQLGILLLLLITGMEADVGLIRKVRRAALSVSVTGIALPFACGFALGEFLPPSMLPRPELRLVTSLFLGTALSISSVKIVAMVVREMDFLRRNVGQIIVASAIIDDTIGWVIIAITFSLAQHGAIDLPSVGKTVFGAAAFLVLSFTVGRRLVFLLIRWSNDHLRSDAAVITTIVIVMGLMALATQAIGVHTVLGAFIAGVLVGQSPILTGRIEEELRGLITGMFAPIFFGLAGLSADLTILKDPSLVLLTAALIAIASIGKFSGAFLGGTIGGLKPAESLALACGMNARGSTEVIVATIGLSIGALNQNLFTMIVAMAVLTTLAMPPTLRWALLRLPLDEAERQRLEREAFESGGFVTRMERLLLAADPTAEGRFAARLAGLLAGSRGMPVTVISLTAGAGASDSPEEPERELAETVRNAADSAKASEASEGTPEPVDIIAMPAREPEKMVAAAAAKGFDLLLVGVEPSSGADYGFSQETAAIVDGFDGPVAIVAARDPHLLDPDRAPLAMLVPVNGSDVSRRGAEVAFALARAADVPVTALFVANAADAIQRGRLLSLRRSKDAVFRDMEELARGHCVALETKARIGVAADRAILRETRSGRYNMVVMGVARRPGTALSFGQVAETVLESSPHSVVFVAS